MLASSPNFRMTLWSEFKLRSAFQSDSVRAPARVMLLFFVLTVNTALLRPIPPSVASNPLKGLTRKRELFACDKLTNCFGFSILKSAS
jgi:hypothetical protein